MVPVQQTLALRGDAARSCNRLRHRLTPRVCGERKARRIAFRIDQRGQLLSPVKARRPTAFAPHLLERHTAVGLPHAGLQMRALLALEQLATPRGQPTAGVLRCGRPTRSRTAAALARLPTTLLLRGLLPRPTLLLLLSNGHVVHQVRV